MTSTRPVGTIRATCWPVRDSRERPTILPDCSRWARRIIGGSMKSTTPTRPARGKALSSSLRCSIILSWTISSPTTPFPTRRKAAVRSTIPGRTVTPIRRPTGRSSATCRATRWRPRPFIAANSRCPWCTTTGLRRTRRWP